MIMRQDQFIDSQSIEIFDSQKYPSTNLKTNHSLILSQTLGEKDIKIQQKRNINQPNYIIIYSEQNKISHKQHQKQVTSLSNQIKLSIPLSTSQKNNPTTLIKLIKMVFFTTKQVQERAKFISNKIKNIQKLRNQVCILEHKIYNQKQQFYKRQKKYNQKSNLLRTNKLLTRKRINTQIIDIKNQIDSFKKKSVGQRKVYIYTEEKPKNQQKKYKDQKIYIPLPYNLYYQNNSNKSYHLNPEYQPSPFTQRYSQQVQNIDLLRISQKNQNLSQKQMIVEIKKTPKNHRLATEGQNVQIYQYSNQILTVPKIVKLSQQTPPLSTRKKQICQKYNKSELNNKDNFKSGESSINILLQGSQSLNISQSNFQLDKVKKPIFFPINPHRDFTIGNLSSSVQSQYTNTQKSSEAISKRFKNESKSKYEESAYMKIQQNQSLVEEDLRQIRKSQKINSLQQSNININFESIDSESAAESAKMTIQSHKSFYHKKQSNNQYQIPIKSKNIKIQNNNNKLTKNRK